jgi:O-methyltransferase involved in polyketide biosynthesis
MMGQKEAYDKIGTTAKLVAYLRTFTDIPFTKEIAEETGAKHDFETLAGTSAESMTQFAFVFEARFKATDRIIAEHEVKQILEIAAGLSPRGLAMTEDHDVTYVATDLPQMLEREQAIAESILVKQHAKRSNLHFRIANALDRDELFEAAGPFQYGRPIAVITEGLLPYFVREEKKALAANIRALLTRYGGTWVCPDVTTRQSSKRFLRAGVASRQRIKNITGATGRDIEKNAFEDDDDVLRFFADAGYTLEGYSHTNVLEDLSALKLTQLNRDEVREILQMLRTLILTL